MAIDRNQLCLDATVVIHFENAGKMGVLKELCDPQAQVPAVVATKEWRGHRVGTDGSVVGCPWLSVATATEREELRVLAELGKRYPSPPDKDRGEAEMVAVSHGKGWIAVCEDELGRQQAEDLDVPRVYIVTLLAAGVVYGRVDQAAAGSAHKAVEASRGHRSILRGDDGQRQVFSEVVQAFRGLRKQLENPSFHDFLRQPPLDGLVVEVRRRSARRAGSPLG